MASGRENYYTGAVAAGEPPGRWYGSGAEALGLAGEVDAQDMTALYEHFVDPRDEGFRNPTQWGEAGTLGHTGRRYRTEDDIYAAALEAEPGAPPERREELRVEAGTKARRNVAFLDATFSVQKSVTVLHAAFEREQVQARQAIEEATAGEAAALSAGDAAGAAAWAAARDAAATTEAAWSAHRQAVEDAIWAGNRAGLDYLSEKAGYSRVGHHGGAAGRYVDAHDWTIASFFQHDSRDHDPQLHVHNAILNRVQGPDGAWRTLDGRSLYAYRGAASAVAERTTEEHLTAALHVRFAARPDGKAREAVGVSKQVMELFSSRRRAITRKTAGLVSAFESKFGREPNNLERDRLSRQATFATRNAKSHDGETVEARLDRWDAQLRQEVAGGLAGVAHDVLDLADAPPAADVWSPRAVIETALAAVQEQKAAWTESDLTRAVSDALPDHLGGLTGGEVAALLNGLTAEALTLAVPLDTDRPGSAVLPDALRLSDGRSAYDRPGARLYATPEHVHSERLLAAGRVQRGAPALSSDAADGYVRTLAAAGVQLGDDQAAAVRGVLTSGAAVETLVGPAGTGKSFVVGMIAKAWTDPNLWDGQRHQVVGLAASQVATDVLAGEGLRSRNITRWLHVQDELAAADAAGRRGHAAHEAWRLRPGDLVVVDESGMADTPALTAISDHVARADAKLLPVGDHRQLAAVGAGGGMELITAAAPSYELTDARRFQQPWERAASLRLRERDASVLGVYHRHGRLLDGGTVEQAEASAARAWLADTVSGRRSVLIVDTNDQAARVSAELRAQLVRLGRVEEAGVPLGLQGTYAGVGDLVQARRNGWHLAHLLENKGRVPVNRGNYRVTGTLLDGGLTVAPLATAGQPDADVRLTLPGEYVREHVALGYASTVHAAQGLTVDTAHTVVTAGTGADALYVGMSRGREANTAHVATRATGKDAPTGDALAALHRDALSVLSGTLEGAEDQVSALRAAAESQAEAGAVRTPAELLADAAELATAGRTSRWFDELMADGHLTPQQRVALAVEDGGPTLARVLRRAELAGRDPRAVLEDAVTCRDLGNARHLTVVLHQRITEATPLDPTGTRYADWLPAVEDPQWAVYLHELAAAADTRRAELGQQAAATAPQWAVEAFGPVPTEDNERESWVDRAGAVAGHRELTGHDDPSAALGRAPKAGQAEEYASWRAAWRALGRPDADRDELELSDGQLRVRVRAAARENTWAPRYVGQELAGTRQTADAHRNTATLRAAEAAAAADPDHRARFEAEAADAAALADVLDGRAAELAEADDARAQWLAHTAETRAAAQRATSELTARATAQQEPDDETTAVDWLDVHQQADRAEDPHREVTDDADLTETTHARNLDLRATEPAPAVEDPAPEETDIRQATADEPAPVEADTVRAATAEDTADAVRRAQRALIELRQRQATDDAHADEEAHTDRQARWHTDDTRGSDAGRDRDDLDAGPVLDRGAPGR